METKNNENQFVNANNLEKVITRRNKKIGKFQTKEMKQVANEKTQLKWLSATRQRLANLQHCENIETTELLIKHINFCEKHRKSALVDFDAKAIKEIAKKVDLTQFVDERGFDAVNALTYCIGLLDKERKQLVKENEKLVKATEKK